MSHLPATLAAPSLEVHLRHLIITRPHLPPPAPLIMYVPPPECVADPEPTDQIGLPEIPIYQPAISTNDVRLPVAQIRVFSADLSLHAFTVQHDLSQALIAVLIRRSLSAATYCMPHVMEPSLDDAVNLERR